MFSRHVNILKSNSFFLLGARGTGKSTLLTSMFEAKKCLWIDLLTARDESKFGRNPDLLSEELDAIRDAEWVIIDEVQKVPKILDVVQREIERRKIKFALTGSSARKLKRGAGNLLAGRAFVYHLFPLTHLEVGEQFHLQDVLHWGMLPKIYAFGTAEEKSIFLETYAHSYMREEIVAEQLIRGIDSFRHFLEVSAQSSGTILNFRRISQDVGSDPKTIKTYFEILADTLVGFFLPAFHHSIRKQQRAAPKFYFIDIGLRRVLQNLHMSAPVPGTYEYGRSFEEFVVTELYKLNAYTRANYQFSYLQTGGGYEIDLIIERPGMPTALVEIKSTDTVQERHLDALLSIQKDLPNAKMFCLCQEKRPRQSKGVAILPWQEGIVELGLGKLK